MSLAISVIFLVVSLIAWLWLVVRIWKSSAVGAVLTFFFGLPAFYFLFKYWGDEEHDIRAPFFTNLTITLAYIAVLFAMPGQVVDEEEDMTAAAQRSSAPSNPDMERWCREKHEAVYDHVLGTCVEGDLSAKTADSDAPLDVMEQLADHFAEHGLEAHYAQVNASTPGARKLAEMPGMQRVTQFEFKSESVMPTMITIAECNAIDDCERIKNRSTQTDPAVSMAFNGRLMFFGILMMGDARKIERAKEAFSTFKPI